LSGGRGLDRQLEGILAGLLVEDAGHGLPVAGLELDRVRECRPTREHDRCEGTQWPLAEGAQPGGIEHLLLLGARIENLEVEREHGRRASAVIGNGERQDEDLAHRLRPIRVGVVDAGSDEEGQLRRPQRGFVQAVAREHQGHQRHQHRHDVRDVHRHAPAATMRNRRSDRRESRPN
jgi:hypothetical protein